MRRGGRCSTSAPPSAGRSCCAPPAPRRVERVEPGRIPARLPLGDGAAGLVTCFEALERAEDPGALLDEIARVLGDEGVLVLAAADRDSYPPGNPLHRHPLTEAEVERELRARWPEVQVLRQGNEIASLIAPAERGAGEDTAAQLDPAHPGPASPFVVALASRAPLPPPSPVLATSGARFEVERWHDLAAGWEERALWAESRADVTEAELTFVTFALARALEEANAEGGAERAAAMASVTPRWKRSLPARIARKVLRRDRR